MNNRRNSNDPKDDYAEDEFDVEILDGFKCPITTEIMVNPVVASDGYSYEEEAIKQWLAGCRCISPLTGEKLAHAFLTPNHSLRKAIQAFLKQHPDLAANKKQIQEKDLRIAIQLREKDLAAQAAKKPKESSQAAPKALDEKEGEVDKSRGFLQTVFEGNYQPSAIEKVTITAYQKPLPLKHKNVFFESHEKRHAQKIDQAQVEKLIKLVTDGQQDEAEALLKVEPLLALTYGETIDNIGRPIPRITAFQYAVYVLDAHMWDMMVPYFTEERCRLAYEQLMELETHGIVHDKKQGCKEQNWDKLTDEMEKCSNNYDRWSHDERVQQLKVIGEEQDKLAQHVISEYCRPDKPFQPVPNFEDGVKLPRGQEIQNEWKQRKGQEWVWIKNSFAIWNVGRWKYISPENRPQENDREALLALGKTRRQQKYKLSQRLLEKPNPQLERKP